MISVIFLSLGITLAILLTTKRLLPRIPNWLTASFVVIVPPTLYVIYAIYQTLVKIGKYEATYGEAPPDVVTGFSISVNEALLGGAIWAILALAASLIALRLLDRNAER